MGIIKYFVTYLVIICYSSCSFRHIGCLSEYKGEQVELLKYIGKGQYIVRPYLDTTKIFIIDSKYLD